MDVGLSRSRFVWILAMEFTDEVLHVLQVCHGLHELSSGVPSQPIHLTRCYQYPDHVRVLLNSPSSLYTYFLS